MASKALRRAQKLLGAETERETVEIALDLEEGLQLSQVRRSFALDVLLVYSCREGGAVLVTGNARDMKRIRLVFAFQYVAPYPERS